MSEPKPRIALTYEEKRSALWTKLTDHWKTQLEILRIQNEGDKTDIETAKLRGRILELKAAISLEIDLPEID